MVKDTHSLRQSDIVDYRAAYFAAKNMNFKLNLGLLSLSYLSQFNSKFNIQDEFWNLEIKSFHLAPRFMGLNALLIEKSPPKDSTEFIVS